MIFLENKELKAKFKPEGAELVSLISKDHGHDLIWEGDPALWGRHAPVLFPIVGALKDNSYTHNGKTYELPRHGFARDYDFEVKDQTKDSVTFQLVSDQDTKALYPFDFELTIRYVLKGTGLTTYYTVQNLGEADLYYSLGTHPAFRIAQIKGRLLSDYEIEFEKDTFLSTHRLNKEGLRTGTFEKLDMNENTLHLSDELFSKDALVFERIDSNFVILKSDNKDYHMRMDFQGFSHLGIWKKLKANFICIEPWDGLADQVDSSGELSEKEGIQKLGGGQKKDYILSMDFQL